MKKILCLLICAAVIISVFSACSKEKETPEYSPIEKTGDFSVVSFNCAAPWGSSKNNTKSSARVVRFAAYMNAVKPDIIGTQEMNSDWQEKLAELMPDYDCYGVPRGGDDNEKKSEMNSIFWLKDKYTCADSSTFWLSESTTENTKYMGAGCNRICSYVVLLNNETGESIIHLNTHLDNVSGAAREYGARLITLRIDMLKNSFPDSTFVVTGDLNDFEDGKPCTILSEKLTNCQSVAAEPPGVTYQNWGEVDEGTPIDFIFTSATPVDYRLLDDVSNGFVSDHYGVFAQINYATE